MLRLHILLSLRRTNQRIPVIFIETVIFPDCTLSTYTPLATTSAGNMHAVHADYLNGAT
jgi:hypothetical protein